MLWFIKKKCEFKEKINNFNDVRYERLVINIMISLV